MNHLTNLHKSPYDLFITLQWTPLRTQHKLSPQRWPFCVFRHIMMYDANAMRFQCELGLLANTAWDMYLLTVEWITNLPCLATNMGSARLHNLHLAFRWIQYASDMAEQCKGNGKGKGWRYAWMCLMHRSGRQECGKVSENLRPIIPNGIYSHPHHDMRYAFSAHHQSCIRSIPPPTFRPLTFHRWFSILYPARQGKVACLFRFLRNQLPQKQRYMFTGDSI